MSIASNLDALIRDIEAATGPDRALDERIATAIGWTLGEIGLWIGEIGLWKSPDGAWQSAPPQFTGSLDAARTMFPAHVDYEVCHDPLRIRFKRYQIFAWAATEPLAMCAAGMWLKREGCEGCGTEHSERTHASVV